MADVTLSPCSENEPARTKDILRVGDTSSVSAPIELFRSGTSEEPTIETVSWACDIRYRTVPQLKRSARLPPYWLVTAGR